MQETIEVAWERRAELTAAKVDAQTREAVEAAIARLDEGSLRRGRVWRRALSASRRSHGQTQRHRRDNEQTLWNHLKPPRPSV